MTFRPGELDQRVTVSRKVMTVDTMGGYTKTWSVLGDFWAHVRPLSGNESAKYDSVQAEARYLFVFRNGIDIQDDDLLTWQTESFNIRVRRQPKNRALYLEVEAERGVAL